MKKITVIFGPNMKALGWREPKLYGTLSYKGLVAYIKKEAKVLGLKVIVFQSDCEGAIVKKILRSRKADGIIINAAAYTHTSIAIADALRAVCVPTVEVHLTDTSLREDYRRKSFIAPIAQKTIMGLGKEGYKEALHFFWGTTILPKLWEHTSKKMSE